LQLRNLQSPVEIGVDKNTTVVFRTPLMSTIEEIGSFLAREKAAALTRETPPRPATAPKRRQACAGGGRERSTGIPVALCPA
jgi:hypothetical protein